MKIIRKPQANIPHELKMPKNLNKIIANQIQQYKNKPTNQPYVRDKFYFR